MKNSSDARQTQRAPLRKRRVVGRCAPRRGLSAMMLILSMGLIFALIALAVDLGLLVQRHQQLKTAGEAAALAAAIQLFDGPPDGRGHGSSEAHELRARKAAIVFAAENSFSVHRLALDANAANKPQGDIVLGRLDSIDLHSGFTPAEPGRRDWNPVSFEDTPFSAGQPSPPGHEQSVNAILVRTRHSQAGGGGPLLFFGQLVGVPSRDLFTESIAAVDRRVCGYRPVGCSPIPLLPLICHTKCWSPGDLNGNKPHDRHDPILPGEFLPVQAADQAHEATEELGLIELTLALGSAEEDELKSEEPAFKPGRPIKSRVLALLEDDCEQIANQLLNGICQGDLADCGDELRLGDEFACLERPGGHGVGHPHTDMEMLHDALQAILGQPRLVPIGCVLKQSGRRVGQIKDFAGCVVVSSQLHGNAITILVRPIVLNSCTAIVDTHAPINPWVGKVLLVR